MAGNNEFGLDNNDLLIHNLGSSNNSGFADPLVPNPDPFSTNQTLSPIGAPSTDKLPDTTTVGGSDRDIITDKPTNNSLLVEKVIDEKASVDLITGGIIDAPLVGNIKDDTLAANSINTLNIDLLSISPSLGEEKETNIIDGSEEADITSNQLTTPILETFRTEAIARWNSLGVGEFNTGILNNVKLVIEDLPGYKLGLTDGYTVTIDTDAAGEGWFIDSTPSDDVEFSNIVNSSELQAAKGDLAYGRVDLLTILTHEFGHGLGIEHVEISIQPNRLMSPALPLGTRRIPVLSDLHFPLGLEPVRDAASLDINSQNIDSTSVTLQAGATRLLVEGQIDDSDKYYSFTLLAGEYATLVLNAQNGGNLDLELWDASGVILARGVEGARNVSEYIRGFVAPVDGTYYARIRGTTEQQYKLTVTRGADFEIEPNNTASQSQLLTALQVLGTLDTAPILIEPDNFENGTILTNAIPGVTLSILGSSSPITSVSSSYKSTGSSIFSSTPLRADFTNPVQSVSIDIIGDDSDDPGILTAYDINGNLLSEIISLPDTYTQPYTLTITRPSGDIAYIITDGYNGNSVYLDNLVVSGDNADYYNIQVKSGDVLSILTTTPSVGEKTNTRNLRLELYNSLGELVSSDNSAPDSLNALINYTVPTGKEGIYTIKIGGENTGTYTLAVNGASLNLGSAPFVTAATPNTSNILATPPFSIDITLSEAVRVNSVDINDLTLNSGTVTGVSMLDGRTIRFLVTSSPTSGTYTYKLKSGAIIDLQGQSNTEYEGNFIIDSTGPKVVAISPNTDTNAPLSELNFSFSEVIDTSTFTTSDIVSFTAPNGTNLLNEITSVSGEGSNFKVTFNSQIAPGTYTMVIGPDIRDVVGNLMDQNSNFIRDESSDIFTATVNLLTPDLLVESVDVPSTTVVLGQTIDVSWKTSNIGTANATRNWSDRIWLSRDISKSNDDILLLTSNDNTNSIVSANGGYYTRSVSVKLPPGILNTNDSYYILVETDASNNQVESNDNNNIGVSQAISFSLPSLPNLVYLNDFETSVGSEWSTKTIDNTYPSTFSRFLGRLSNGNTTLTLNTVPGATYRLEFDFYAIDSWEGDSTDNGPDYLNIFIDNTQVFKETFSNSPSIIQTYNRQPDLGGVNNNLGFSSWGDSIYRRIPITFTATKSTEQIRFAGGGLQGLSDESWGIDNVRVWSSQPAITPDLQVETVNAPSFVLFGETIDVNWIIRNIGNVNAITPWSDRIWLSRDTLLSGDDVPLLTQPQNNPAQFLPGATYSGNAAVTIPFSDILPYEIEANNSIATANDLSPNFTPIGVNTYIAEVRGEISTSRERDYFKIFASPGDIITIEEFGSPTGQGTLGDTYIPHSALHFVAYEVVQKG